MKMFQIGLILALTATLTNAETAVSDNQLLDTGSWPELQGDLVGDVVLQDGSTVFSVDAPYRANDAATVPIVITETHQSAGPIRSLKLIIDENPAPLAAEFVFGEAMEPLQFETRVRVNQYSNVRVVAELPSGSYMNGRFVKASGGCSAPATRNPEVALAAMGEMRLRSFGSKPLMSNQRREVQIMIRHPNYSGLQRDQITQLFIGAHFISDIEVYQGEELLFTMEGGISISENPVFRFHYTDNGSPDIRVRAIDTEGNIFEDRFEKQPPA